MQTSCEYPQAPGPLLFSDSLPGGGLWSFVLRRHLTLRLTALGAGANVSFLAYNADAPLDRLNLPDTLKAQYTAKLTRGHLLMSDMGHALLAITADTCGWHDPLGGHTQASMVQSRYGKATYQEHRNAFYRNAHDNFLIELSKHGLGARDLTANVNFFSRVDVDEIGKMQFHPGNARAGDYVDLRAEMNVLVILTNCQHPLDPSPVYAPQPLDLAVFQSDPTPQEDYCRNYRLENYRSLVLTERLFLGHSFGV